MRGSGSAARARGVAQQRCRLLAAAAGEQAGSAGCVHEPCLGPWPRTAGQALPALPLPSPTPCRPCRHLQLDGRADALSFRIQRRRRLAALPLRRRGGVGRPIDSLLRREAAHARRVCWVWRAPRRLAQGQQERTCDDRLRNATMRQTPRTAMHTICEPRRQSTAYTVVLTDRPRCPAARRLPPPATRPALPRHPPGRPGARRGKTQPPRAGSWRGRGQGW